MIIFLFHASSPPEVYTLSLHDALPIYRSDGRWRRDLPARNVVQRRPSRYVEIGDGPHNRQLRLRRGDRKSTRLNSSHVSISYAVFCSKKKIHTTYQQSAQLNQPSTHNQ